VPRERVFLTTKFLPSDRDPSAEAARSLERLGVDYVDLYLVHWPEGGAPRAWPGMEQAQDAGYARSIGVSNYGVKELDEVLATASIRPVVNQVQFSPFEYRRRLLEACEEREVALEAYSPLGTGRHLGDPEVARIAQRTGHTPAQVLIRWCLQRDTIVIPKSAHRERIAENGEVFDLDLSEDEMRSLDALDRTGGTGRARGRE
jgi:diketogulonate reductase-like aldo/keto reductase